MMITKIQAATLYAYGYRLVDKEGKEYKIVSLREGELSLFVDYDSDWKPVLFSHIGVDYFILARPLDLHSLIVNEFSKKNIDTQVQSFFNEEYIDLDMIQNYEVDYLLDRIPSGGKEWLAKNNFNIGFPEGTVKHLL